jgi:Tellurite resistance protein TehB
MSLLAHRWSQDVYMDRSTSSILAIFALGLAAWPARAASPQNLSSSSQAIDADGRAFWNSKFSDPQTAFNHQPSKLRIEAICGRKPGQALGLGMGEGRNAIYLARQSWQVTSADLSDVAVAQAK